MTQEQSAQREKELFEKALDIASAEARAGFLDGACGGDADLRARLDALLRAHAEATGFLPETSALAPTDVALTEKPGDQIGRYKLLQEIGEGGCGGVCLAEQREPSSVASRSRSSSWGWIPNPSSAGLKPSVRHWP